MSYTCGCGMKSAKVLKEYLDSKGLTTYFYNTSDYIWPYRKPRIVKDNLKFVVVVWAGKRYVRPEWRFLAVVKKEGFNFETLESEMKSMRAYPYIRVIQ